MFLALPNPLEDLIKRLDKIFYKFLWNSGPNRIKQTEIIKDVKAGGLRMVNIKCGELLCGAVQSGVVLCGVVHCGMVRSGMFCCGALRCCAVRSCVVR